MRAHQPRGPYRIAGYSSAGIVAYEMARQLATGGEKVGLLALLDSFSPLAARRRRPASKALRRLSLRKLQERIYHAVLFPLGLSCLRRLHNIGEAQRWAYWSYRPRRHTGGASLFLASDSLELVTEPTLGWARLIRGPMRMHHLAGGHSSLMKPPRVAALAAALQAELDQAPG
jgi:thioesterase domain-containing protein